MSKILKYCKKHNTWQDGLPFSCDCFCGLDYGGNPDNLVERIRYDIETQKLMDKQ